MRNRALQALSPVDVASLRAHLEPVDLVLRTEILRPYTPVEFVYFGESGLLSLLARAGSDRIEVGLIGFENIVGANVVLGVPETPFEAIVQAPGTGHRIRADVLRDAMARSPTILATLLPFVHAQMIQIAQTALANGRLTVEQRLARWLLMAHDRLEQDDLSMTHEFLALMLGVRRPGVTVALHILEGTRAIRARRGQITILDRETLKGLAGSAYGEPEAACLLVGSAPAAGGVADRPAAGHASPAPESLAT